MAVEELSMKIDEAERERQKRYPLLDIVNNREEIREISDKTVKYVGELYPELAGLDAWEIIPRTIMEFFRQYYVFINNKKKVGQNVSVSVGDFVTIGIEHGTTTNGDKDGTFNPIITVGSELQYNNKVKDNSKLSKSIPVFSPDDEAHIEFVCKQVQNTMKSRYGVIFEDYNAIVRIFIAFMRVVKQYLVDHKEDEECGILIQLGTIADFEIKTYDVDGGVEYTISINPGQRFKLDNAKGDDVTEAE